MNEHDGKQRNNPELLSSLFRTLCRLTWYFLAPYLVPPDIVRHTSCHSRTEIRNINNPSRRASYFKKAHSEVNLYGDMSRAHTRPNLRGRALKSLPLDQEWWWITLHFPLQLSLSPLLFSLWDFPQFEAITSQQTINPSVASCTIANGTTDGFPSVFAAGGQEIKEEKPISAVIVGGIIMN